MLRALVVAIGVACIVGAAFLANQVWFAALELAVFGALILIGTFFKGAIAGGAPTGTGWQRTAERFVDPVSGKLVEVRYNPKTGERAYVDAKQ